MPAFLIGEIDIHDPAAYEAYRARVPAVIAAHGGRYLVRGGASASLSGDWHPKRLVVLEFPDMSRLRAFWDSAEYAELRAIREQASTGRLIAVEGYQ